VEAQVSGEQERHVRATAARQGLLGEVVDPVLEPGRGEHVFRHPLAPLAARLRAGQGLVEGAGGPSEFAVGATDPLQLLADLSELGRPLLV